MRKKQKFLVVYVVLLLIINSVVCYADTTVKGGYYRLRNYASGMYLNWNNNSNLVQKSFPSYLLPQSFLITSTEGYKNSYTIHPKTSSYYGLAADYTLQTVKVTDSYFENNYLWNLNYANNGAFTISSKPYGTYMGVGDTSISKNGAQIYHSSMGKLGSEKWYLEKNIEDGVYFIKNKSTGMYLSAEGSGLALTDQKGAKQQFKIRSYSDGYSDIMFYYNPSYSISVAG